MATVESPPVRLDVRWILPILVVVDLAWFADHLADGTDYIGVLRLIVLLGAVFALRRRFNRRTSVVITYAAWWSALIVGVASHGNVTLSPRSMAITALVFHPITDPPLPGLDVGAPLALALALVVLLPDRLAARINPPRVLARSSTTWLAALVVLFGRSCFDLIARQFVEGSVISDGRVVDTTGPITTMVIWSLAMAIAMSVPIVVATGVFVDRIDKGAWHWPTYRAGLAAITSGALLVRIATLLTVAPVRTDGGDPLFYHSTANILAQGGGFPEPLNFIAHQRWIPSALHGPLYPVVLSISSRLGGTTYFDHKFVSLLIGTAVVLMTGLVAWRVAPEGRRSTVSLVAAGIAAVYPNLWIVDSVMFPEGLMALCCLGVVYCAYRWRSRPALRWSIGMGAITGLAALTRGEGLLLTVVLIVPWILLHRPLGRRERWRQLVAAGLACLIVLAPWMIRNARSFENFVPLSTNGNELFVYANCDETYSGKFLGFWLYDCQEQLRAEGLDATGDEAAKSLHWRRLGLDYAREHAGELPKVITARVLRQWELFRPWQNADFAPIEGRNKTAARAGLLVYYVLAGFSLVGGLVLRRRRVPLLPLMSLVIGVTLTAAYAYGTTRFRVPAEPVLCVLGAVGIVPLLDRWRRRWPMSIDHRHEPMPSTPFVLGGEVRWRNAIGRSASATWASIASIGVAVGLALPSLYRATGSTMEEGFMLVFPERVMKGAVANVDFLHLYGPGSLHALSLWYRIFGVSLPSERTFGLLQHLLVVFGLYVVTRPWGRITAVCVSVSSLVFVLTPIGLQALAWSGAVGLGLWAVILAIRATHTTDAPRTRSLAGAGLLTGLALTFRPDLILALGLGVVWLVVRQRRGLGPDPIRRFAAGMIVGLTSVWVHLVQAGPNAFIRGVFIEPVFELRGGRELPRPPSWDHLDGALQVIGEKFAPWWGLPSLSGAKQLFLWFFALPIVALAVVVISRRVSPRLDSNRATALGAVAMFGVGLLPQALQRPDSAHFNWVACISWPIAIVAIADLARWRAPRVHPTLRRGLGVVALTSLVLVVAPHFTARTYVDLVKRSLTGESTALMVERNGRTFNLGDTRPWRATQEVIADLDRLSEPGQRLLVGPVDLRQTSYSDAFFYYLFPELTPATYFIEMDPGLANEEGSRLAGDVASADWLILTRFWSGWIEPNDSIVFGSDLPNQVVERSFCLRGSYQADVIRLYERCSTGDDIGPYDPPYKPRVDYAVEVLVPVPPRPDGTCTPTCNGRPAPPGEGFSPEEAAAITERARAEGS
jgi:4-amino-4-deoxy-L-arabinose transferase-like glycosyltransferase